MDRKHKGFTHILVLILIILGIGVLGYFFWQKGYIKPNFLKSLLPVSQNPTTTPTLNPTDGWKTYINNIQGITFKYPPSWNLEEKAGEVNKGITYNTQLILSKENVKISMYLNMIGIGGMGKDYEGTRYLLDGNQVYKYKVENSFDNTVSIGLTDTLKNNLGVLQINSKTYSITLNYPAEFKNTTEEIELEKEFDQILSTFKFTDITTGKCPQGFELYDGTQLSICYPSGMTKEIATFNSTDNPSRPGVSLRLTNSNELISVMSVFSGGWGGDTCYNEKTKVRGVSTDILKWDEDGTPPCSSVMTHFVAVVGERNESNIFPVVIDYQRTKGGDSLDEVKFTNMLNSLVIK